VQGYYISRPIPAEQMETLLMQQADEDSHSLPPIISAS